MKLTTLVLALALTPAWAQDIKFPPEFEKLAARASEVVDVTLDGTLLQLAARFLSNRDPDEARVKQLVSGLKGIYVRSFEFDKDGEYSKADIDSIRNQLKPPTWQRMVSVRERGGENADVYFRMEGTDPAGLLVISAEERELTVVNIIGRINPEELSELGGHFGIPRLRREKKPAKD